MAEVLTAPSGTDASCAHYTMNEARAPACNTIDDLIRERASEPEGNLPIVGYPAHTSDYVDYTPVQLHNLCTRIAAYYSSEIPWRLTSDDPVQVIGLLGLSNLEYLITMLAISRLGHTVLFLSTRISSEAYVSLLTTTKATKLLFGPSFSSIAKTLPSHVDKLTIMPICTSADVNSESQLKPKPVRNLDSKRESSNISWIIHSSGSTGLPKPIFQTHSAALRNYAKNFNLRGFITLPLFHAHGVSCLFRAIHSRKQIYVYGAHLPLTAAHLITTLKERDIGIFYGVPYALKLLSEREEGLKLLARLELVMFGGSACPKPIGDKLVAQGVQLISHYGTTETGQLMTSFRPRDDKDWDYVRPAADLQPFLRWDERGPGIFELVVLDGWPSKVVSNCPDGSYATKDLFERHPTLNAWRYYARQDDTLVLDNGEKANPLTREGVTRENRNVAEAIVFGANKPRLGLFIIPSVDAQAMTAQDVVDSVWPALERSNLSEPAYARLSRDMIFVLSTDTDYKRTDKGTIIRAAFYRDFKEQIEAAYVEDETSGTLVLEGPELRQFLHKSLMSISSFQDAGPISDETDLFSLGVDSLQATMLRKLIVKSLSIGSNPLGGNFVFDNPSIEAMAVELTNLRSGVSAEVVPIEEQMAALIKKYSDFTELDGQRSTSETTGGCFVVTGATGSLGAHIVAHLVGLQHVDKVFCLVRARSPRHARCRVRRSLQERRIYHTLLSSELAKIVALPSDFAEARLGLDAETYTAVTSHLSGVIHSAWSVNFNYSLRSFEKDCIAGARHLIDLCLASQLDRPAHFNFCSSVSAVAATPGGFAPESLPESLSFAQNMGYAQSKLVTEHICMEAAKKIKICARVLRVGQIVADTKYGIWNATEAIPLIFQSALTTGILPNLDENPSWLPVDIVAKSVSEISLSSTMASGVVNLVNHNTFHWTRDLLPMLKQAGLVFEGASQREWIAKLRASDPDPAKNPAIKLVDFFAGKYDRDTPRQSLYHESSGARANAPSLRTATALDSGLVAKFIKFFTTECWNSSSPTKQNEQHVLFLCGPCGSGKTTAAMRISTDLHIPNIEGDELHTAQAIESMRSGKPLSDEDRWSWLERVRHAALLKLQDGNSGSPIQQVTVSCSALKRSYRDDLRKLTSENNVSVAFIMLTGAAHDLRNRVTVRHQQEGHYMKAQMVDSQLDALEMAADEETDITPIDTRRHLEEVLEDVIDCVKDVLDM